MGLMMTPCSGPELIRAFFFCWSKEEVLLISPHLLQSTRACDVCLTTSLQNLDSKACTWLTSLFGVGWVIVCPWNKGATALSVHAVYFNTYIDNWRMPPWKFISVFSLDNIKNQVNLMLSFKQTDNFQIKNDHLEVTNKWALENLMHVLKVTLHIVQHSNVKALWSPVSDHVIWFQLGAQKLWFEFVWVTHILQATMITVQEKKIWILIIA